MKKHILFGGMLLIAAAFTSCTEDFKDWATPQFNGPEDAITIPGFTASAVAAQDLATAGDEVPTFTLSAASLPDGYELDNARIELTPKGVEDAEKTTVKATLDGMASKETLQELIETAYGRRPTVRTFDGHVLVNAKKDGQAVYIDAGNIDVNLTPEAPYIAPRYYVIGGAAAWSPEGAYSQPFSHSDADVYDDPIFTIVIDAAAEGDTWFAIGDDAAIEAVAAGDWSKLYGIVGGDSQSTEGKLDYRYNLGQDNSFCVPAGAKKIRITIDMMESTFKVEAVNVSDAYYLIGGPGEWSADAAWTMQFSHSSQDVFDDPVFTYVFEGNEGAGMWFAFGDADAITAVANGDWNQLYGYVGEEALSGTFDRRSNIGQDNSFHVDGAAKYYRFQVNMLTAEYTITPLDFQQYVYFIGATDGWANAEQRLESPDCDGVYTGFIYCADPNGWGNEFKFQKTAGDWGTEVNTGHMTGGISGDFEDGGGNFRATAGEGVYYIVLDLGAGTISGTKINNMNLVGDFNGWNAADDAQQMTWNAADYCFEITGAGVTANGWKFTSNNSWDINLGGTVDNLVANGDNLSVVGSTIKLYPTRKGTDKIYCTVE